MRKLILLLVLTTISAFSHSSPEWNERPKGYRYLMYSDPMYLKLSDGSKMKIQVLAYAGRDQDKLNFVIDDRTEDEGMVSINHRRTILEYSESGFNLRADCISLLSEDTTYNHSCSLYSGKNKLKVLDVINRIYPKKKSK